MDLSERRILITGGAGFIGSHLATSLLERDNAVVIADDFSNSTEEGVPDDAVVVDADLTNREAVEQVVNSDQDIVFHLGARKDPNDDDPRGQFAENTTMTHLLLEQCRKVGVEKFAFASSSTVYGEAPRPTSEDYGPLEPISVYGASKLGEEGIDVRPFTWNGDVRFSIREYRQPSASRCRDTGLYRETPRSIRL